VSREGFLIKSLAGVTTALESVVISERSAGTRGLLQSLDPRIKLVNLVLLIGVAAAARSLWILAGLYALVLVLAFVSRVPPGFFFKRVIIILPFTALIALPALFITPGEPLWQASSRVILTEQGLRTAAFLLLRVLDSVSFGLLLILTTPWNAILNALSWFRLPPLIIDIQSMTYRYIFLLLHTANNMFLARRSRSLGGFTSSENRRWLSHTMAVLLAKSQHLSEDVYLAMTARGYLGEFFSLNRLRFKTRDFLWLGLTLLFAGLMLWSTYR
jgi:cobalt/nickel transport system permease protein